jgi:molybdate transport system permease protein
MSQASMRRQRLMLRASGGVLLAFLMLPLLALFSSTSLGEFLAGLSHPLVGPALRLSLYTTSSSLIVVVMFGTPLAWSLGRAEGRLARAVETAVQLPIVIPPAVAGVAMLIAYGRRGPFAGWLYPANSSLAFSTAAVVMAEVFVSAPFFVQAATSAFRRIDQHLLLVGRSFGASPFRIFFRIALPLATPGLIAGAAMSWARSLGEFGATLMFAGNLQGRTQTLPLAIYTSLESDLRVARALALVLVCVALALLVFMRTVLRRWIEQEPVRPRES